MPIDGKEPPHQPQVYQGQIDIRAQSGLTALVGHFHLIDLDKKPQPAPAWVKQTVDWLKAAPDRPTRIDAAAQWLAAKMLQAFRRGQVDACWTQKSLENHLRKHNLWNRARRPRRPTS
jgi:hypothetical protein